MTVTSGARLARLVGRSAPAVTQEERCELCGAPTQLGHRHVLDLAAGDLRCACTACALLFEREAAGRGHYRLVPQRRVRLAGGDVPTCVPVGLAFVVRREDGAVTARYPSPIGTTTADVDDASWAALCAHWPQLTGLQCEVEALLTNTTHGRGEHWIAPIDECYRLVAVVQRSWQGFSGGGAVWPAVDAFFADLGKPARGRIGIGAGQAG